MYSPKSWLHMFQNVHIIWSHFIKVHSDYRYNRYHPNCPALCPENLKKIITKNGKKSFHGFGAQWHALSQRRSERLLLLRSKASRGQWSSHSASGAPGTKKPLKQPNKVEAQEPPDPRRHGSIALKVSDTWQAEPSLMAGCRQMYIIDTTFMFVFNEPLVLIVQHTKHLHPVFWADPSGLS